MTRLLRRFYPLAAFLGGFAWDVMTLGRQVTPLAFWRLGAYLACSALLAIWLARRHVGQHRAPASAAGLRAAGRQLLWHGPFLLMQFFFGGIFSALFILYFKSAGHLGTWLVAICLGGLLIGNEFARDHYRRRFTLNWSLLALNAILLFNFALPHFVGSTDARWFYLSTAAGLLFTLAIRTLAPGRPGKIWPAWLIGLALMAAFHLNMIAPVPLVKRELLVGLAFHQRGERYLLTIERAPAWQFWRDQSSVVHLAEGERLYGVSAIFAPAGITADLEHRWEYRAPAGWQLMATTRFQTNGGRALGFRGYSWIGKVPPGEWRLTVATQDGRTIGVTHFSVEAGAPAGGTQQETGL